MSTRTHFYSLSSIAPLQSAIASNDVKLVRSLKRWAKESDVDGVVELVAEMIQCDQPPNHEPGKWIMLIRLLGENLELDWTKLPLDDWKHYATWMGYGMYTSESLTAASKKLLGYLENGRPLVGGKVVDDGCLFGWLENSEIRKLHKSLAELDTSVFPDDDFRKFHDEVLISLQKTIDSDTSLVMLAH